MTSTQKYVIGGMICGIAAAWIKSKVESDIENFENKVFNPNEGKLIVAKTEETASEAIIKRIGEKTSGEIPDDGTVSKLAPFLNYGFGIFTGLIYILTSKKSPYPGVGYGIPFGIVTWGITHGVALPALEVQKPIEKMPVNWWLKKLGAYAAFGISLELSRRILFGGALEAKRNYTSKKKNID